ncbi:MAG: tRNA (adenosine(37)-N6)-dimethylallyltransferase MiaA [candidate division NC10 bacterium]|nr:tRNA (adenosine(37)-N6)-dimethylallyltransferase MiaA [candidate division NC10 bacterium]
MGKTALAVALAKAIGGEIVALDSMQVYRSLDIGTAKPTPEAQKEIPHHLIDVVDPWDPFTAIDYALRARQALKEIHARGRLPLVVGGSGLYLRALCGEIFNGPSGVIGIRTRLTQEMKKRGAALLHARLTHLDPSVAARIHPKDAFRLIRALEIIEVTGRRVSELWEAHRQGLMRPSTLLLGLRRERTALYNRINDRVDRMVASGLVEEVDRLLKAGHPPHLKPLRSHNYRHIIAYLLGDEDLDEAVRRTKQETRHYAKRQMTWFRSENEITWFDVTDGDSDRTAALLIEHIQRRRERYGTGED